MKKLNLKKYTEFAVKEAVALLGIDSPTGYTAKAAQWVKDEFEKKRGHRVNFNVLNFKDPRMTMRGR